jgi:hypothetical protein
MSAVQAHYTEVLMRDMAQVPFPPERIHSTTLSGEPKASVLARLAEEHPGADAYVFVEDKFLTLEKVGAYKASGRTRWHVHARLACTDASAVSHDVRGCMASASEGQRSTFGVSVTVMGCVC